MNREKLFDLVAVIIIASFGLFTAYVCFGILKSQADAELQQYSVSGAIAGALISWSLLASLYLQFRKSSDEFQRLRDANDAFQRKLIQADEIKNLREHNEELQQKLLRGAPRPPGCDIEISERHRLVFARPKEWEPRGGLLFDCELPDQLLEENDLVPARLTVEFSPITEEIPPMDKFYDEFQASVYSVDEVQAHTCEQIYLGGESRGIKCLKFIADEIYLSTITRNKLTGKVTRAWEIITRDYAEALLKPDEESNGEDNSSTDLDPKNALENHTMESETENPPDVKDEAEPSTNNDEVVESVERYVVNARHMKVVCYNKELENIFFFDFYDDIDDFSQSSAIFNQVLSSIRFLN